jgi:hypothetical protein
MKVEEGLYMQQEIVYDPSQQGIGWAQKMHDSGNVLICPKCGSKLVVALTLEEANQNKVHPGIFCPQSHQHVFETVNLVAARNAKK